VGTSAEGFILVGEAKDWQVIFREDIEKTNELQKEYEELIKKFRAMKKHLMSNEKRRQINILIDDIKIKLENVKRIDDKQVKLFKNYCGNYSVLSNRSYNN
jgi:hypothetical protein